MNQVPDRVRDASGTIHDQRNTRRSYRIVAIPGDGTGPEILGSALEVLSRLQDLRKDFSLKVEMHKAGAGFYRKTGEPMSKETLEACRQADAILRGPVGDPSVRSPDGTEAGMLGGELRIGLDPYANVRSIQLLPSVTSPLKLKPGGTDAQGEVTVRLEENGNIVTGQGAHEDIIMASAMAYVNALNKLAYLEKNPVNRSARRNTSWQ